MTLNSRTVLSREAIGGNGAKETNCVLRKNGCHLSCHPPFQTRQVGHLLHYSGKWPPSSSPSRGQEGVSLKCMCITSTSACGKLLSCTIRLRVSCGLCPLLPLHLHMAARKNQRQTLSFIALSRGLLFPRDRLCWGVSELSPTDPENIANERARFSGRKKKTSFQAQWGAHHKWSASAIRPQLRKMPNQ